MNRKSINALEARKAILREVARAFYNAEVLTKVELQTKCKDVNIDTNVIGMLTTAGVIKSARGRKSAITMLLTPMHVFTHVEELAAKMVRPESYFEAAERKVVEDKKELKEVIKRLKKDNQDLSELLDRAWKEIDVLTADNKALRAKLEAVKAALR